MRPILPLAILVLLLAGCAERPQAQAEPTPTGDVLPAGVSNLLEGRIQGTDFAPIANATVALQGTNLTDESDAQGQYRFESLPPKEYIVVAAKEGFRPKTQRAIVEDEKIFQLDFVLDEIPIERPYSTFQEFVGFISCQAEYQTAPDNQQRPNCGESDANNKQQKDFLVNPGVAQLVLELKWTPRTAAASQLTITVQSVGEDGLELAHTYGPSVLKVVISQTILERGFRDGGAVRTVVQSGPSVTGDEAAADAGLAFQQDYKIYFTAFYVEPGPASFSAIPP